MKERRSSHDALEQQYSDEDQIPSTREEGRKAKNGGCKSRGESQKLVRGDYGDSKQGDHLQEGRRHQNGIIINDVEKREQRGRASVHFGKGKAKITSIGSSDEEEDD